MERAYHDVAVLHNQPSLDVVEHTFEVRGVDHSHAASLVVEGKESIGCEDMLDSTLLLMDL
jgi:hypothetical protein